MLTSVHIENIALIRSLDVSLDGGFTAFTGETGAGKSIVIDSIGLACGARISKEIIRAGESEARVEALFCDLSETAKNACEALGLFPDEDGCYFVTRTVNSDGKSTARINGRTVPVSLLREAAPYFINIHGQHDNAELLNAEKHIGILDAFTGDEEELRAYREAYSAYRALQKELDSLDMDEKEKQRQIDMLSYQIREIKAAKLKNGEEEALKAERNKLKYTEKISRTSALCYGLLYESTTGLSAADSVEKAHAALTGIGDIIPEASSLAERLESIKYELVDIAETAEGFADGMADDPTAALDKIESRLDVIGRLCSRYGADIAEVNAYCAACEKKLSDIELSEEHRNELTKELVKAEAVLEKADAALLDVRQKAAARLNKAIGLEMSYLDMNGASFDTAFSEKDDYTADGKTHVEFLIRMNAGEEYKPLSKTASGGELSRLMLAIRSVLAEKDGVDTLIFDEIDTGISGRTSRRIGIKLSALAKGRQVLCVTHSAQVCSLAGRHYKIEKTTADGRTTTGIRQLSYDERIRETARIISGMDVSDASLASAKELIDSHEE